MSSDDTTGKQPKTEEEPREDDYDDDDSAFEQQKALVSKRKAVPKRRQKAKPATMVCLPCRTSKRRCDGKIPCHRCVEQNKAELCIQVVPKKRGRKRKVEEGGRGGPENSILALAPDFDMQDLKLGTQQHMILSIMMAYADQALHDRPRDIAASFGLDFQSGFVAVEYAAGNFLDPLDAFWNSRVVSAGLTENPKFPDIVSDPSVFIGRTIKQLTVQHARETDTDGMALVRRVLTTPSPTPNRPWIRRYRTKREIYSQYQVPARVVLENTIFMNERGEPQWMFIAIADRQRGDPGVNVQQLDTELFLTSSGFDSSAFSLSDTGCTDLMDFSDMEDAWTARDLGSKLVKLDNNLFDLPL